MRILEVFQTALMYIWREEYLGILREHIRVTETHWVFAS